jgi:hypothetical protein
METPFPPEHSPRPRGFRCRLPDENQSLCDNPLDEKREYRGVREGTSKSGQITASGYIRLFGNAI